MKQSDIFRESAENCARLAEAATNQPLHLRYKRMEAAWLASANEHDWLDDEVPPIDTFKKAADVRRLSFVANSRLLRGRIGSALRHQLDWLLLAWGIVFGRSFRPQSTQNAHSCPTCDILFVGTARHRQIQ